MEKPLRALHILNAYDLDGPGRLILDLTVRLRDAHGIVCETLAISRSGRLEGLLRERGVVAHLLPEGIGLIGQAMALRRFLRENRYDIVHTHLLRADVIGRRAAAREHAPVIVSTEHGIHTWGIKGRFARPWIKAAYRWSARGAARIVAVSNFVAGQLAAEGVPAAKIVLIHNGVDVDRFRPLSAKERRAAREEFGVGMGEKMLAVVGKMVPLKGQRALCEALPRLMADTTRALRVMFAGDGPEREECKEFVRRAGLADRVYFIIHVGDSMPRFLGAADMLVQPSRMESFCLAAAEAMACGVPVCATRVGGLPELVRDGIDGVLLDPAILDDPERFAGAIRGALDDARLTQWGRAAAIRARENFSIDDAAARYAQMYREEAGPLSARQKRG